MQAVELLDSCSRTVTVTRISARHGVVAFQVETGAFPDYHPRGAAAVDLPGPASDEPFTPLFADGRKDADCFIGDGDEEQLKICSGCQCPMLNLETGESVQLRQMMCHQVDPRTGQCRPLAWTPGRDHYFPCVWHAHCAEQWFATRQSHIGSDGVLCPVGCGWRFGQGLMQALVDALLVEDPGWALPPTAPPPPLSVQDVQALVDALLVEDPAADALEYSCPAAKIVSLQGVVFPPAIRLLRLDGNQIQLLQDIAFPHALQFLNLSCNSITVLPQGVDGLLPNLPHLQFLHLACNGITSLQGVAFPDTLKVLNLDGNRITTLQHAALPPALECLMLSNNALASLQNVAFPATLQQLNLDNPSPDGHHPGNAIATLHDVVFPPALQILRLSGNRIESLQPGAEVVFPETIQRLDLGCNLITHLQGFVFRTPSALRYLNLSRNQIEDLQAFVFPQSLEFLGLHRNPIALAGNAGDIRAPPGCSVFMSTGVEQGQGGGGGQVV